MADQQTIANDIAIALALTQAVMTALPQTSAYAPLIAMLGSAAERLAANIGTEVTYSQLEGLRVKV